MVIDELLGRRCLIFLGKGGVGRTSVAAAMATAAADRGRRVLLMEYDRFAPLSALFGYPASYEPVRLARNLWAMALDGARALEEYLGLHISHRRLLHAAFSSGFYQYFVHAAPGLRELVAMGKFYHEIELRPAQLIPWDLVILDAPASAEALALLRMPLRAYRLFGDSLIGHEARNIAALLRDPGRCGVIQIVTPDSSAINECLENLAALERVGIDCSAFVLNRMTTVGYSIADVKHLAPIASDAGCSGLLSATATAELRAARLSKAAMKLMRRATDGPIFGLPNCQELSGLALIRHLGELLVLVNGSAARR
jgi:arsenite/tail-anchored protein-transporting ATPase